MYLNKKLIYRFLSKFMSSLPINFLHLLQLNPASLSVFFIGNFCVAFSLKKAASLTCVTQFVLLYFAPFLSFSTPLFPALHCYQVLDPTSAGCLWRSATAHFGGTVVLCGQDQRKHHCRQVPDFRAWFPSSYPVVSPLPSPSSSSP